MKQTDADRAFAAEFAREIRLVYESAKKQDALSDSEFAVSLGVTRGALWKYLYASNVPTPSIQTIVLAYENFGVLVPYRGRDLKQFISRRKTRLKFPETEQMELPFTIRGPAGHRIGIKLQPRGANHYEIKLSVKATR